MARAWREPLDSEKRRDDHGPVRIVFSTACLDQSLDQAGALERLLIADLRPVELGSRTGEVASPDASVVAAHLAFLPAASCRINLASADDDLRRKGVMEITEALARCEWLGIPLYQLEAGWNLAQTLPRNGRDRPEALPEALPAALAASRRPHALAQLERSLDRLATEALDRGLTLGVVNMPPGSGGLLALPAEIREVLAVVGAPNLRLSLDLGALGLAGRQDRPFDPDEAAAGLRDLAGAIRVPPWSGRPEPWIVGVCAALEALPIILEAGPIGAGGLRSQAAAFEEALHAPA